jgi:hypothetical protein
MREPRRRGAVHRGLGLAALAAFLAVVARANAGHESPWYPSFYPQEIRIEAVDPGAAAPLLQRNSLHAFIGGDPFAGGPLPPTAQSVRWFGSYVVATFNPGSAAGRTGAARCALGQKLLAGVAELRELFTFHPYPVTPYHPDYLAHFDLAQARKKPAAERAARGQSAGDHAFKLKARGRLAEALGGAGWPIVDRGWDVAVEEVDLGALLPPQALGMNGRPGPPWLKEGWYHAHLLLAGAIQDAPRRQRVEAVAQRLMDGSYDGAAEQLNLERALVSTLGQGCERTVLGYTTKGAVINDEYSQGAENIAVDSQAGAAAPIFVRTVKLKDFPWNGWLKLGIEGKPGAAWNPLGGLTDPFGRLLWAAAGDPAFLPAPNGGTWVPNRVSASVAPGGGTSGKVEVPPDALLPEPGTGAFRAVGPGKTARAKALYRVPASAFHDGSRMAVADLIYPYAFAARATDPLIGESTTLVRRWLAGFRVLRVERVVKELADLKLEWPVPVIEVYLRHAALDPQQTAAAAPPWGSLPWHLTALMEEAVARGYAAFSQAEATRRGVAWLDLVRDPALHARLAALAEEFERAAYVPDALKGSVTPEEARRRWAALRQFAQKHHHFLVTNGPYLLEKWSADSATLQVFRDLSYPVGVGTFDAYVHPPRAFIASAEARGGRLHVTVEMEKAVRAQRSYRWTKGPLTKDAESGGYPVHAVGSYVALGPDGKVRAAGTSRFGDDATFTADLRSLKAGPYTLLIAVSLNGNQAHPDVKVISYQAGP